MKEACLENKNPGPSVSAPSSIFSKIRNLGLVCDSLNPVFQKRETASYLIAGTHTSFHIYDLEKLELLFIGPSYESIFGLSSTEIRVTALAAVDDLTIAAVLPVGILSFCDRGQESFVMKIKEFTPSNPIVQMECLGAYLLILFEDGLFMQIDISAKEVLSTAFPLSSEGSGRIPIRFMHPSTYLNKILFASNDGSLSLYNFRSGKIVYTLQSLSMLPPSSIVAVYQTPALDIIVIGFSSGYVGFFNIKTDQLLFRLQLPGGPATAMCFRTENNLQQMITGNAAGDIFVWDLNERTLVATVESAHKQAITMITMLPGTPVFVSTGCDNCIKEWIFPTSHNSNLPELYKFRSGHSAPPRRLQFYGDDGQYLLSFGSDDTFRAFSLYKDSQAFELSQAKEERRRNAVISFDSVTAPFSSKDGAVWDNIISCHLESPSAQLWSFTKRTSNPKHLDSSDKSMVTCCALSRCGHFGFIGTSTGLVEIFNVQSGIHRGTVKHDPCPLKAISVCTDGTIFASLSTSHEDELVIKFWSFKKRQLLEEQRFPLKACSNSATRSLYVTHHPDSDLLAICCGCEIYVLDFTLQKVVRHMEIASALGSESEFSSISFSGDGKWAITTDTGFEVKIWDIPSGTLKNSINLHPVLPTGAVLSPTGETLAIIDRTSNAISLWTNMSFYGISPLPDNNNESVPPNQSYILPKPSTSTGLITLSASNSSFWNQLVHLSEIKEHSRPKQPVSRPASIPFFLSNPLVSLTQSDSEPDKPAALVASDMGVSEFESLLMSSASNYDDVVEFLHTSSASAIDYGIRTLLETQSQVRFLGLLEHLLESRRDYDLVTACLHVFLECHRDAILTQSSEVSDRLENVKSLHLKSTTAIDDALHRCLGLVRYCLGRLS